MTLLNDDSRCVICMAHINQNDESELNTHFDIGHGIDIICCEPVVVRMHLTNRCKATAPNGKKFFAETYANIKRIFPETEFSIIPWVHEDEWMVTEK